MGQTQTVAQLVHGHRHKINALAHIGCILYPILIIVEMNIAAQRAHFVWKKGVRQDIAGSVEWEVVAVIAIAKGHNDVSVVMKYTLENQVAVSGPLIEGTAHPLHHFGLTDFWREVRYAIFLCSTIKCYLIMNAQKSLDLLTNT